MNTTRSLLAAVALMGLAGAAQARDLIVQDNGENFSVSYAQGYTGNVVGGGAVRTQSNSNNLSIFYEDARFAQQAHGTPVDLGGNGGDVSYVAQADSPAVTR